MGRTRISTTVDSVLLAGARQAHGADTDAQLIDAALAALLRSHRSAAIDASYLEAYTTQPIDEADEWGDLETFRRAAAAT